MSQRGEIKMSATTVFISVVATLTVVLPIVVGILAAEIFSEELLAQGAGWQLSVLVTALVVLVVINIFMLGRTIGRRGK